jgi:hypothetical protein
MGVLARYRELGSNLEASIQVRKESEKGRHWHRMHERCWCGHLGVPSKFYRYKDGKQVGTQGEAEAAYLAAGGKDRDTEMLERYVPTSSCPHVMSPLCSGCGKNKVEARRAKCSACRKRTYRERGK